MGLHVEQLQEGVDLHLVELLAQLFVVQEETVVGLASSRQLLAELRVLRRLLLSVVSVIAVFCFAFRAVLAILAILFIARLSSVASVIFFFDFGGSFLKDPLEGARGTADGAFLDLSEAGLGVTLGRVLLLQGFKPREVSDGHCAWELVPSHKG